jgi:TetR/AcrR family transcriptional repressor of nem operon
VGRTSDARERLIESGRELMHERGYTAVGVAELCSRAGVQKGSFYHLFPSKQELALEVIESYSVDSRETLEQLAHGEAPPLERLEAFLERSYQYHCETRKECGSLLGCALGNLALEMSTQDVALREKLREIFDRHVAALQALITEAAERGEVTTDDPRASAESLFALVEGTVLMAKTQNNPEALRGLNSQALRLLGARKAA